MIFSTLALALQLYMALAIAISCIAMPTGGSYAIALRFPRIEIVQARNSIKKVIDNAQKRALAPKNIIEKLPSFTLHDLSFSIALSQLGWFVCLAIARCPGEAYNFATNAIFATVYFVACLGIIFFAYSCGIAERGYLLRSQAEQEVWQHERLLNLLDSASDRLDELDEDNSTSA